MMGRVVKGFTFGPFQMDVALQQLTRDGVPVPLTGKAFLTLLTLVRSRDRLVPKEELISTVWQGTFVSDESLTQSISTLRRLLGDDSSHPSYIETVPRRGYRFIAPVIETLGEPPIEPSLIETEKAGRPLTRVHQPWITAAVAGVLLAAFVGSALLVNRPAVQAPAPTVRFTIEPAAGTILRSDGQISPDGRYLVFVAQEEAGNTRLWLRELNSTKAAPLSGSEGGVRPFWSPDSLWIGFFANYTLKKLEVGSSTPITVAPVGLTATGASWSSTGLILFSLPRSGLYGVDADGGEVRAITVLDRGTGESAHHAPQFLPDGEQYLFRIVSTDSQRGGTYAGRVGSEQRIRIFGESASFAPPGYLLHVRDGLLLAQRVDTAAWELDEETMEIARDVPDGTVVSATQRILVFARSAPKGRLAWFARSGEELETIETPVPMRFPTWIPGRREILAQADGDHPGIWLVELNGGASTEVTNDGRYPLISPSGDRILFASDRGAGVGDIYTRASTGQVDELLLRSAEPKALYDWSRDGRYIAYVSWNFETKSDIWLLPTFGDTRPVPFLQAGTNENQPRISPDGRWIAYSSDETGSWEVYIQSFPGGGGKRRLSLRGGAQPQWRADGRELFYLSADHTLMAVTVAASNAWNAERPMPLFRAPVVGPLSVRNRYLASDDGERFIIEVAEMPRDRAPLTVLLDWLPGN